MKHFLTYILFIAIGTAGFSQGNKEEPTSTIAISFPDSVRIALEKTKKVDAQVVGTGFFTAWGSLDMNLQNKIKAQNRLMRQKGYSLRPTLVNYYGAIADAVSIEKANPTILTEYLEVCQQIIENYDAQKATIAFKKAKDFFQHHALHYEKTLRLYAVNDEYHFEFISAAPSFLDEPIETSSYDNDSYNEDTYNDSDNYPNDNYNDTYEDQPTDNYYDDSAPAVEIMPIWMTPPPQPSVEGPIIKFNSVTLNMVTKYDSVFLQNTKGSYSLMQTLFVGDGGKFDWTTAGLSPDSVYCTFSEYHFLVNRSTIQSDLVKLKYLGKFDGEIPGTFEFRSQNRADSALSSYPRFKSYQSDIPQDVGSENIKFTGGFSLLGRKITSESASGDLSTLEVSHEGQRRFVAKSASFQFQDSTIAGENTRFKIYQLNDSIVHPSVRIRYDYGKEKLVVRNEKGAMHYTPYSSSYFNMDFSADLIRWDLKSDSLNLSTMGGRDTDPIVIESVDYYDAEDFQLLKGKGFSFHPIVVVANYCFKNKTREFYLGDIANFYKKDLNEMKSAMQFLAQKGFITYDPKTQLVKVKEKTVELYWAYKGESDYDNLKIHSVIDSLPNATINYANGYMTVRGVDQFRVSDSLNVMIDPDSSIVTLLQNRDIMFDGTIDAGNFQISGKGFTLKYDSFFISLTQIDSINFYVTEENAYGQKIRRKINNSMVGADSTAAAAGGLGDISQSSGTLYISKANNKSGKRKIPNYPRLDATTGGVIYFDREEVLNGVYDRSVFFVIPPFKIDSLNDADPASINFEGTFVSSGMFPNFKEKLHTMPDKSLGFEHAIPKPGYKLYNGEGVMNGALSLNNRGLRGGGKIEYLAATINSPDFVFYPDSVIARGQRAKIEKSQFGNVLFPQASLPEYEMKWYPKEDKMNLKNLRDPFNFYDSTAQLNGKITISKEGVFGEGKMDTRGTELLSKNIEFTGNAFGARNAKFKVNSNDPRKPLMFGNNIRLKFNLEENYADISPEVEGEAAINFPYAQVKTSMPNARWDLTTQKITMTKREDVAIENSYFYSTRKELDSLYFNAESAEYDMKTQELKVSGIPYIVVADAKITPENNEVLILENSRIGTLSNTTIVLDTLNGYHRLTEGVVDIVSRKEFTGYATYQYVNFLSDTFAIKMTDFHLEPVVETDASKRSSRKKTEASLQTVAKGVVTEKEKVVLGAGMFYKGDLTMYATKPALQLNGYVKLDLKNIPNYNTWIEYQQTGDETEVLIDFANAVTDEGKRVRAGLHFSESNEVYITFLNDKRSESDDDLFTPAGSLFYDTESKEYKIEDPEKSKGNKLSGKVFAYNDETRKVRFEGPISLLQGSGDFNIQSTCLGSGNLETNQISMNAFMVMNTNVPSQAFDLMGRDIVNVVKNEGADEGLGDPTELLYKIADIVGEKTAKSYEEKSLISYVSLGEIPALAKPIVISNVNLKWSDEQKAFYSEGSIGVSNILRHDINGGFEGFLEIKRSVEGDPIFNLFIKASPDSWYYFGFEGRRLLVYSSNNEFNSTIGKKSNAGKAKIGEVAFVPGSEEETLAFINYFRSNYYGIESPYNLQAASSVSKRRIETQPQEQGDNDETEQPKPDDDGF